MASANRHLGVVLVPWLLAQAGATPPAIQGNPSTWLPVNSCPLIVSPADTASQPLRIAPQDVAAKNQLGCLSPNDAIYGADGCPLRQCGSNKGAVPLPSAGAVKLNERPQLPEP